MGRSILAVTFGFIVIGVLVFGTEQLFSFAIDGFDAMITKPDYYYLISIVTTAAWSIVGGWTCASIAKTRVREHIRALALLGQIAGIVAAVALWKTLPHYYLILLLVLYPPALIFGGKGFEWTRPLSDEAVAR